MTSRQRMIYFSDIIISLLVAASECVQSSVYKLTKLVILYTD